MTYPEFLTEYADRKDVEWVNGLVVPKPCPDFNGREVYTFLMTTLHIFVDERELGEVLGGSFQMYLRSVVGESGREPKIMFIARQNQPRVMDYYLDGPADLAVEIVSEDSVERDYVEKFEEYQAGGVREYWIIDPAKREAHFYQLANGAYQRVLPDADGLYHCAVIPGVWLRTEWLWQVPPPRLLTVLREWGVL